MRGQWRECWRRAGPSPGTPGRSGALTGPWRGSPGPGRLRPPQEPLTAQQGLPLLSLLGIWHFVLQETVTAAPDLMNTEMCTEKSI